MRYSDYYLLKGRYVYYQNRIITSYCFSFPLLTVLIHGSLIQPSLRDCFATGQYLLGQLLRQIFVYPPVLAVTHSDRVLTFQTHEKKVNKRIPPLKL